MALTLALEPAHAAFSGKPGAIAFSRQARGAAIGYDIWTARPSGGGQRRLTTSARASETEATHSPDGGLIAYVRRFRGDADIWVMRADGSGKRPLVESSQDDVQPSFFPGGRSIVFTVFDGERDWTTYSVRLDGSRQRRQAPDATHPIVSPNGRWLAYSQAGGGSGVRLRNLRSGATRRLTGGSAQELDFSPDGRRIAFTGQRRCRRGGPLRFALLTVGIRNRRPEALRRSCRREFISPAWSPNGSRIVFARKVLVGGQPRFRLAMIRRNGAAVAGAPNHRRGVSDLFPSWQPRRASGRR